MRFDPTPSWFARSLFAGCVCLAGCSGGSGNGGSGGASGTALFFVQSITVQEGQEWQLNRPIRITFSQPVDFATVDLGSINLREVGGANALGEFFTEDAGRTVVFQPFCPTLPDLSDAALQPGGLSYELTIVGSENGGGFTVRSTTGETLETSEQRRFVTPLSTNPAVLFFDPVVGPPQPVVRGRSGVSQTELNATYVEVGGDADVASRLYFRDTGSGIVLEDSSGAPAELPANLYSSAASQFALVLFANQPISPQTTQSTSALRFEFDGGAGGFVEVPTRSELVANCTSVGAVLRIEPIGVMPPGRLARLVLTDSFEDITTDVNQADIDDFAVALTAPTPPSGAISDEYRETFDRSFQNDPIGTFHDFTAQLADPPAVWEEGSLAPGFAFEGNGGPGGDFDFEVPAGQSFTFNTSSTLLLGGPNFQKTTSVVAFGGVLNVDDLRIGPGALLKCEGPNPVTIVATGTIDIQGTITCTGVSHVGVVAINQVIIPEPGATGVAGGGRGGTGSPLTSSSSPRGGTGFAAFNVADGGGQGGEAGWNTLPGKNLRRGAGGGGGTFGADQILGGMVDERYIGLNAESGFLGGPGAFGALQPCGQGPPIGGTPAPSPFKDADPNNNFFGQLEDPVTGQVVIGELPHAWAGSGGGAGGDAAEVIVNTCFPDAPFLPAGDQKGGGGGGGGGSFTMLAIGPIVWGKQGQVRVRGGFGGAGESTNFVDRVGSAGAGGSGGHVVIQTAARLDFTAKAAGDIPAILATGGQGGAGRDDLQGATTAMGQGETTPMNDACPSTTGILGSCFGPFAGAGGDGGPGVVQLHTPLGQVGFSGDIRVSAGGSVGLEDIVIPAPVGTDFDPVNQISPTRSFLIPQFGQFSRARSVWVPLGAGGFQSGGPDIAPTFEFGGTLASGLIDVVGTAIVQRPAINPPATLGIAPATPYIAADEFSLVVDASTLPPALSENPNRLIGYLIDLVDQAQPTQLERFEVTQAAYDAFTDTLILSVPMTGPKLTSFNPGSIGVELRPAFFRVDTNGTKDFLPTSSSVTILFDAAPLDPVNGGPDEANSYAATVNGDPNVFEPDIAQINAQGVDYRFVRFEVRFDIGTDSTGTVDPSLPRPSLDFLRVPFGY